MIKTLKENYYNLRKNINFSKMIYYKLMLLLLLISFLYVYFYNLYIAIIGMICYNYGIKRVKNSIIRYFTVFYLIRGTYG